MPVTIDIDSDLATFAAFSAIILVVFLYMRLLRRVAELGRAGHVRPIGLDPPQPAGALEPADPPRYVAQKGSQNVAKHAEIVPEKCVEIASIPDFMIHIP